MPPRARRQPSASVGRRPLVIGGADERNAPPRAKRVIQTTAFREERRRHQLPGAPREQRTNCKTGAVRIVILAGGVGGSKFVLGVRRAYPTADLTVIANTADDITLHGLRICPDLDTIMYTLGGGGDPVRGWGRE